jgi:hypothetical protein
VSCCALATAELRSAWTAEGGRPYTSKSKVNGGGQECPPYTSNSDCAVASETPALRLDVQVLHIQRVVFYEFSSGFYVFAH